MQSFTGPFDGPPVRASFANYTDTLRKYEAMALRETLPSDPGSESGNPNSVTRIELPAEGSLGKLPSYKLVMNGYSMTLVMPEICGRDEHGEFILKATQSSTSVKS